MPRILAPCAAVLILVLGGGCASNRTQIQVQASPGNSLETSNCPEFSAEFSAEFCGHGQPLSQEGLALLGEADGDADVRLADADTVGLTTFGPALRPRSSRPGAYFLGAGDSLGHSVFGAYAVFARAEHARDLHELNQRDQAIVSGEPVGE